MNVKTVINAIKGCGIAAFTAAVLVLTLGFAAFSSRDPDKMLGVYAYAALYAGAVAGGFAAVRLNRSDGLACGGLTGAFYASVITLVSFFVEGGGLFFTVGIFLTLVGAAAAAGFAGLPKAVSAEKRRLMLLEGRKLPKAADRNLPGQKRK